jgi:YfiH family protein
MRGLDEPIPVLSSRVLAEAGFSHAFTTRASGDFAILRNADVRRENERELARSVGFEDGRLFQARQVHGQTVVFAEGDPEKMLSVEADAVIAQPGSGAAVAVRVADCVPILIAHPKSGRVAAVHAGWRGVVGRVIEAAIDAMKVSPEECLSAIGPCIGPCCFEVGADVGEKIGSIVKRQGDKAYVDLRKAAREKLRGARVDDVAACTKCDPRFYSYRREGDASGRQVGVIVARLT